MYAESCMAPVGVSPALSGIDTKLIAILFHINSSCCSSHLILVFNYSYERCER